MSMKLLNIFRYRPSLFSASLYRRIGQQCRPISINLYLLQSKQITEFLLKLRDRGWVPNDRPTYLKMSHLPSLLTFCRNQKHIYFDSHYFVTMFVICHSGHCIFIMHVLSEQVLYILSWSTQYHLHFCIWWLSTQRYVQKVKYSVCKHFAVCCCVEDMSCRSKLATLNEKLTTLERRVEYIEARVSWVEISRALFLAVVHCHAWQCICSTVETQICFWL